MLLAIVINVLILIALLTLNAPRADRPRFKGEPILIDISSEAETAEPERTREKVARPKPQPRPAASSPTPVPPRPVPTVEPPAVDEDRPLPFLVVTKEQFAASDLTLRARRSAPSVGPPAEGGGRRTMAGDTPRVGTAPNGEPLYAAEWQREPTDAELSFYLPKGRRVEGSGLVACRTVERYHVEDCVELGSSPPGSGLASAVRQAAWQFLVRPPRVGGKPLIGTWVRIRIDYTVKREE